VTSEVQSSAPAAGLPADKVKRESHPVGHLPLTEHSTARSVSNGRPAALFIAPIMPSDRGNGLAMRTGFLLSAYAKRFAVDLAVIPIAGTARGLGSFPTKHARRSIVLPVTAADTQFLLLSAVTDPKVRVAAFRDYGRPSIAAGLTSNIRSALHAFAGDVSYTLVHVSRLYLASLARPWMEAAGTRRPSLVIDCDEDDVSAYRRLAQLYRKWGRDERAEWAKAEAEAFRKLAGEWLHRFDLVLASSSDEARVLLSRGKGVTATSVPNVIVRKTDWKGLGRKGGCRDILFVGNMSYLPNVDAAKWFASRILPRLRRALPFPLRFVIAGDTPPREVTDLARHPGIVVAGRFNDVASLYRRAALAVIPIRAGGGTRIKLIEAAKYGVPVVATRFGASGTGFRSGRELLLADNERDFAAACARLMADFRLASRLVAGARRGILRDFDAGSCSRRLLGTIERLSARE
jgi:polysaccharide biosynthesis protein PslH